MYNKAKASICGWKYYCPVCSSRVSSFKPLPVFFFETAIKNGWPYGDKGETCNRNAYSCPECGASDRDRLIALHVNTYLKRIPLGQTFNVLDFAPQTGLSRFIIQSIRLAGIEGIYRTADLFRKDVDYEMDICDMHPVKANSVDLFICSHVLEHVVDDRKALKELFRVLVPGGSGVLMVPIVLCIDEIDEDPSVTDEAERWRRFGQNDHVRLYSKKGFLERVRDSGFLVSEKGVEYFGAHQFARCGIASGSILYVVGKADAVSNQCSGRATRI